jgi:hypothetical protein
MKLFSPVLMGIILLSFTASLSAGEMIIYGGVQKPGNISWSDASPLEIAGDLKGDFGGTFGIRFSAGRIFGMEQGFGYSPHFAQPGVKAFQSDTNILIQAPGRFVPYVTAGFGLVRSWGQDNPLDLSNPKEIAAFIFSTGNTFAVNYGGGLKIRRIAGPIGINIDVRSYTLPGAKTTIDEQPVTNKGLSFVQTTAGLVMSW